MADEALMQAAAEVRARAYAPYSGFAVGAALRSLDGRVFAGCNVENAAYPEGLCAEAGAIAAMVAGGAREVAEMVVIGPGPAPLPPCGGCRQKLAEFSAPDVRVTMATPGGPRLTMTVAELLPGAFGPAHLGRG
jgi:cytidine deaminase